MKNVPKLIARKLLYMKRRDCFVLGGCGYDDVHAIVHYTLTCPLFFFIFLKCNFLENN